MPIEVLIEHGDWQNADVERLANMTFAEVMDYFGYDPELYEVSLLACDDSRIAGLNGEFRAKNTATNVLSWPSLKRGPTHSGGFPRALDPIHDEFLGDIALAYETCCREADSGAKLFSDHVNHLMVHGLLHLMGFDHETDADATVMERIETEILGKMGINAPYTEYE